MSIIEKAVGKLGDKIQESKKIAVAEEHFPPSEGQQVLAEPGDEKAPAYKPQAERDLLAIAASRAQQQSAPRPLEDHVGEEQQQPTAYTTKESSSEPKRGSISIPFADLSEHGMITPQMPRSRIAEEYRAIKRPLLMNIAGKSATEIDHPNLIMVTSALQGDGKTFSAVNLALSIAMEQDKTVLFVDADISKASAGSLLGIPDSQPGLIDILEGKGLSLSNTILNTNIHNLRVLPAGNLHDRATELLASESMRKLMLELSRRYADRVIVFDSPPLLLTSEAAVLSNLMGQIVFVVGAESTPQSAVTEALASIGKDKVIGMLLNRVKTSRIVGAARHYGYGYGYGYGGNRDRKEES